MEKKNAFQGIFGSQTNQQKYELFFLFLFFMDCLQIFPYSFLLLYHSPLYGWMYHDLLTSILLMGIYIVSHLSLLTNSAEISNCTRIISQW